MRRMVWAINSPSLSRACNWAMSSSPSALSAAAYLCASGPGLEGDAGLRRAYFSYNHSDAYVAQVLGHAREYQQSVPLD